MIKNKKIEIVLYVVFILLLLFVIYCFINIYYNKLHTSYDDKLPDLTELSFDTKQYRMDGIKSDTTAQYTFIVKNVGNNPLFIHSVNPSCLCTNYYVSKTQINQQDTAKIVLVINTKDKKGFYDINTIVVANTKEKYYLLKLVGEIKNE